MITATLTQVDAASHLMPRFALDFEPLIGISSLALEHEQLSITSSLMSRASLELLCTTIRPGLTPRLSWWAGEVEGSV